jgi:hypothetical protein
MRAEKKILLLVLLTLLVLFPTEPVIAAQKLDNQKVVRTPFTNQCVLGAGNSYAGEQVISETNILTVQDAISTGYIEANLNSPISGTIWARLSGTLDLNTMLGSFNGKWIITTDSGTFEGSVVGVIDVASVSGRFVGQGTNELQGQKIKGSFEGIVNNYIVALTLRGEVTCKVRKNKSSGVTTLNSIVNKLASDTLDFIQGIVDLFNLFFY